MELFINFMNLNNRRKNIEKVKQYQQNVNIIFHLQILNDGCQLNDKQIF